MKNLLAKFNITKNLLNKMLTSIGLGILLFGIFQIRHKADYYYWDKEDELQILIGGICFCLGILNFLDRKK